ncbi:MAG: hypothetical protein B7Z66_11910 [Chromatiales bacterium 21-64-14]|nr:MAG: hypothetical protein B7Z66_11910 [Chromatiales bacterium 21-64-14]
MDLANIANEAVIRAVREGHDEIAMADFEAAIDRVIAGAEKKHRALNAEETRGVAYHESGHTLVTEVRALVEEGHARAREIMEQRREALEALAKVRQEKEVIDGEEVKRIIGGVTA